MTPSTRTMQRRTVRLTQSGTRTASFSRNEICKMC